MNKSLLEPTSIPVSHQPNESSISFTLWVIRGTTVTLVLLAPDHKTKQKEVTFGVFAVEKNAKSFKKDNALN